MYVWNSYITGPAISEAKEFNVFQSPLFLIQFTKADHALYMEWVAGNNIEKLPTKRESLIMKTWCIKKQTINWNYLSYKDDIETCSVSTVVYTCFHSNRQQLTCLTIYISTAKLLYPLEYFFLSQQWNIFCNVSLIDWCGDSSF